MNYQDQVLECKDPMHDENTRDAQGNAGSRDFVWTAQEQEFYAQKGFTEPQRCPACRAAKKNRFNDNRGHSNGGGGARQMYPAVCASCGRDTEVPFEPRGDK